MSQGQSQAFAELLHAGGLPFAFQLYRKPQMFGDLHVDHVWMDTRSIYGQRGVRAMHLQPMADYFWMRCRLEHRHNDARQQEIYLLAWLCPHVRPNAAHRLLPGSCLFRRDGNVVPRRQAVRDLQELLLSAQDPIPRGLTREEFHSQTQSLLMPRFTEAHRQTYWRFKEELFTPVVRAAVADNPAGASRIIPIWERLKQRFGRHSDRPLEREVLDVLSYEAMAAMRRCYACVWNDLIAEWVGRQAFSATTIRFLQWMHLEQLYEGADGCLVSLFHGHIFALHPAVGMVMQTDSARGRMADYLRAQTPEDCVVGLQRLLNAVSLSLFRYHTLRDETRLNRRSR